MRLSRRGFLGALGISALGVTSFGSLALPSSAGELLRSTARLPSPFTVPLPIPGVAKPVRSDATTDHYEITQRAVSVELLPGLRTPILSYDGTFPGPTLITRRGRRTIVNHRNELPVPTTVHLHGGHTPPDSDGYPTDLVHPAATRAYDYPGNQRAATLWYHDHRMDHTGAQVYRGLAGFHLIHDDEESSLPLPHGDRDLPLMITDRAFAEDGSLLYPSAHHGVEADYVEGVFGDVILVNGAPWPVAEVDAARYRLRILNASNARSYRLRLDPPGPLTQIGSDGGLLAGPVAHGEVEVAPGERFDVVVDFSAYPLGTEVTLHNGLGSGTAAGSVMRFVVTRRVVDDSFVPDVLSEVERLDPAVAVRKRTWRFGRGEVGGREGWLVNDRAFDPRRVDAEVALGEVEVWRFMTDLHHPVHVHLDPFQVVSRRGAGVGDYDLGWKDTVSIGPTDYVDVVVRFSEYVGRYMVHCHNLEHEDMGMMAGFSTVSR